MRTVVTSLALALQGSFLEQATFLARSVVCAGQATLQELTRILSIVLRVPKRGKDLHELKLHIPSYCFFNTPGHHLRRFTPADHLIPPTQEFLAAAWVLCYTFLDMLPGLVTAGQLHGVCRMETS